MVFHRQGKALNPRHWDVHHIQLKHFKDTMPEHELVYAKDQGVDLSRRIMVPA